MGLKQMYHLAQTDPAAYYRKYGCLFFSMMMTGFFLLLVFFALVMC